MLITSENNKRIARNTIFLYCRLFITIIISLYTSRVILNELGVDDYGIYNVVGGFVSMFAVFTSALAVAISRFITFEIGRDDPKSLKSVFSTALFIQLALTILILILTESLGLWFLNNKLVIPFERLSAANWVFQFSVVSFCFSIVGIPFQSAIIAHERISAYALMALIDSITKLSAALSIHFSPIDKLIWYGLIMVIGSVATQLLYVIYARRNFRECKSGIRPDKLKVKEMFGFASWNMLGGLAAIVRDQGGNIVLNMFFGPAVNAARGIANQVCLTVNSFVTNFQTAINPQIIKSYASSDKEYLQSLIFRSSKYSAFIILLFAVPLASNIQYVLRMWLGIVPEHTALFVQLVFLFIVFEAISNSLLTTAVATGEMKLYQLIIAPLTILNIPISCTLLYVFKYPELVFVVSIFISFISIFARLWVLKSLINMCVFTTKVILRVVLVVVVAPIIPFMLAACTEDTLILVILRLFVALIITMLVVLYVGCEKYERQYVYNLVVLKLKTLKQKLCNFSK